MLTTTLRASLTIQTTPDVELSIDRKQLAFLASAARLCDDGSTEFRQFVSDLDMVCEVVTGERKPLICDRR